MQVIASTPGAAAAGLCRGKLGAAIVEKLDELARSTDEAGRLTRLYLSPAHRRAVDRVARWMTDAGMAVRLDAVGSLVGRYEGASSGAPALLIGSHIDTVRDAGRFDGNLGVVAGIELVAHCRRARRRFPFAIEVVAFGDEEGIRFASTLGGSRAMAGSFDPRLLDERDENNMSRREALAAFGCDVAALGEVRRTRADTLGYVELHIEQGPVLEAEDVGVGVVTAIDGATRGLVEVLGEAGHAGTVPMPLRHDALAAAAEMILLVERRGRAEANLVATVGRIETPGGAVNTVPGKVSFSVDIRAPSDAHRQAAVAEIEAGIRAIAAARHVRARIALTYEAPAAVCDAKLTAALARSVERCGHRVVRLASGAGHDAMAFRDRLPFAMLFVRCRRGLSHHPDEFATTEDIDAAAGVLVDFVTQFENGNTGDVP